MTYYEMATMYAKLRCTGFHHASIHPTPATDWRKWKINNFIAIFFDDRSLLYPSSVARNMMFVLQCFFFHPEHCSVVNLLPKNRLRGTALITSEIRLE